MTNCSTNSMTPILQVVYTSLTTAQTSVAIIPADITTPQITEGDALLSLSITPTSPTSTLVVEFSSFGQCNSGSTCIYPLFRDAGPDALATVMVDSSGGNLVPPAILRYVCTSGSTSPTTFKIRFGSGFGAMTLNCDDTLSQVYNGVASTVLCIKEFAP